MKPITRALALLCLSTTHAAALEPGESLTSRVGLGLGPATAPIANIYWVHGDTIVAADPDRPNGLRCFDRSGNVVGPSLVGDLEPLASRPMIRPGSDAFTVVAVMPDATVVHLAATCGQAPTVLASGALREFDLQGQPLESALAPFIAGGAVPEGQFPLIDRLIGMQLDGFGALVLGPVSEAVQWRDLLGAAPLTVLAVAATPDETWIAVTADGARFGIVALGDFAITRAVLPLTTFPTRGPVRMAWHEGLASMIIGPLDATTPSLAVVPADIAFDTTIPRANASESWDALGGWTLVGDDVVGSDQRARELVIDATLLDLDGDHVAHATEIADGTSPLDADSDDDGAPDGAERAAGTNPLDAAEKPAAAPVIGTFGPTTAIADWHLLEGAPIASDGLTNDIVCAHVGSDWTCFDPQGFQVLAHAASVPAFTPDRGYAFTKSAGIQRHDLATKATSAFAADPMPEGRLVPIDHELVLEAFAGRLVAITRDGVTDITLGDSIDVLGRADGGTLWLAVHDALLGDALLRYDAQREESTFIAPLAALPPLTSIRTAPDGTHLATPGAIFDALMQPVAQAVGPIAAIGAWYREGFIVDGAPATLWVPTTAAIAAGDTLFWADATLWRMAANGAVVKLVDASDLQALQPAADELAQAPLGEVVSIGVALDRRTMCLVERALPRLWQWHFDAVGRVTAVEVGRPEAITGCAYKGSELVYTTSFPGVYYSDHSVAPDTFGTGVTTSFVSVGPYDVVLYEDGRVICIGSHDQIVDSAYRAEAIAAAPAGNIAWLEDGVVNATTAARFCSGLRLEVDHSEHTSASPFIVRDDASIIAAAETGLTRTAPRWTALHDGVGLGVLAPYRRDDERTTIAWQSEHHVSALTYLPGEAAPDTWEWLGVNAPAPATLAPAPFPEVAPPESPGDVEHAADDEGCNASPASLFALLALTLTRRRTRALLLALLATLAACGTDASGNGFSEGPSPDDCGNTKRDEYHCGRCQHTCWGAACVDGQCQASEPVWGEDIVLSHASDGEYAAWMDSNGRVLAMQLDAYTPIVGYGGRGVIAIATPGGNPDRLRVVDGYAVWTERDGLMRCRVQGCPRGPERVMLWRAPDGATVDFRDAAFAIDEDDLVWVAPQADGSDAELHHCTLPDCADDETIYLHDEGTHDAIARVLLQGTHVVFAVGTGLHHCELDDCQSSDTLLPDRLMAEPFHPPVLRYWGMFDLIGDRLVWGIVTGFGGPLTGTVWSCTLPTCEPHDLYTVSAEGTFLATDGKDAFSIGPDGLKQCDLDGCGGRAKTVVDVSGRRLVASDGFFTFGALPNGWVQKVTR